MLINYHGVTMLLTLTKFVFKKIGVFKNCMPYLPNYVPMYCNYFIKSCFSYCLMFGINNVRSGIYKLIDKIDKLITQIVNKMCITPNYHLPNVWFVYKLQCLSFMNDLCYNNLQISSLSLYVNKMIHSYCTRSSTDIQNNTAYLIIRQT